MKKLHLKKESLAELSAADLESVAGGTVTIGCTISLNTLCIVDLLRELGAPTVDCTQVTW